MDNTISLSRQQQRKQERAQIKQKKGLEAYLNGYCSRREVLNLSKKMQELDQLQDATITLLIEKEIFTQPELQEAVQKVITMQHQIRQIVEETDWKKKFEMCEQFGIANKFLRDAIDAQPEQVSKDILEELKAQYWPTAPIEV